MQSQILRHHDEMANTKTNKNYFEKNGLRLIWGRELGKYYLKTK